MRITESKPLSCLTKLFHRKTHNKFKKSAVGKAPQEGWKSGKETIRSFLSRTCSNKSEVSNHSEGSNHSESSNNAGGSGGGTFLEFMRLRKKIIIFRDIFDIPPLNGSVAIHELVMATIDDLNRMYPDLIPGNPVLKMKERNTHQGLICLYHVLECIADSWVEDENTKDKFKKSHIEIIPLEELVEVVRQMLDCINNAAKDRFEMMDVEQKLKPKPKRKQLVDLDCNSPGTPTSVLPDSPRFADLLGAMLGSYSSPQLLNLRAQTVEKLSPTDLKRLVAQVMPQFAANDSYHQNMSFGSLDEGKTEVGDQVIIEPNVRVMDNDETKEMEEEKNDKLDDERKEEMNDKSDDEPKEEMNDKSDDEPKERKEEMNDKSDDEPKERKEEMNDKSDDEPKEMKSATSMVSESEGVELLQPSPSPTSPLSPAHSPENVVSTPLTSPSIILSSAPPPPPPKAAKASTPPPTPPPSPSYSPPRKLSPVESPPPLPPPPPPPPRPGTSLAPPPPPPPVPSSAPPSPAPKTSLAVPPPPPAPNASLAVPPPPPPVMGKGGQPPPPPGSTVKRGDAPPPPGGMRTNVRPRNRSKLKRSTHMGNLYRVLRGKVEGSCLPSGKPPPGSKNVSSGKNTKGGGKSMADALAEMTKRSSYFQQIEGDMEKHGKEIKELQRDLTAFHTSDMDELLKFHSHVESVLEILTDETQILSRFEGFPMNKLEILRMAATLSTKLSGIVSEIQNWKIEPPLAENLDKVEKYFNKMKGELEGLERTKDEESKKFQGQNIHFDFIIFTKIKESMVDLSSGFIELALKERREAQEETKDNTCSKTDGKNMLSVKMLWRAFQFAFKVYSFAGGQDERADSLTRELAREIESDSMQV